MQLRISIAAHALALIVIFTPLTKAAGQDQSLSKLFAALDKPVLFAHGIDKWKLEDVLDELREKSKLEFVIDTEAFKQKLNRKDVANSTVSFDKVSGIPTSLFLDLILRQIDAHFETRDGKVHIVPATDEHSPYHPACLPSSEERRTSLMKLSLQKPVVLDKGLEEMTFGEAKNYFEDRFDLTILVDQSLFPKGKKRVAARSVELPAMNGVPLEKVLNSMLLQIDASMKIRGGAVLIIPKENNK